MPAEAEGHPWRLPITQKATLSESLGANVPQKALTYPQQHAQKTPTPVTEAHTAAP